MMIYYLGRGRYMINFHKPACITLRKPKGVAGVLVMARLTGREPCPERFSYWVGRGIKIEVHPE